MAGLGLVKVEAEPVTAAKLKELFPKKKGTITEELVGLINEVQSEPEFNGSKFVDTLYTYQNVMLKNSGNMEQYIDAIRFCAYVEAGNNSIDAYKKTFIRRDFVQNRLRVGTQSPEYKELTSATTRFRKSPMVVDILTQADVPLYLMFQGERYRAVAKLVEEMDNATYSKDRINAAKAVLENVKPPDNIQIEMDIGVKESDAIAELRRATQELASKQLSEIKSGGSVKTIAESTIVEAEIADE